jgi:signal transduction histidine kinase
MLRFGHRSIGLKLPLGIAVLLALACGGVTTAAYLRVRASAYDAASSRLAGVARQIQDILATSMRTRLAGLGRLAADGRLTSYASAPRDETRQAAARGLLESQLPANTRSSLRLTDLAGALLVGAGPAAAIAPPVSGPAAGGPPPVGPFVASDTGTYFELAVPVGGAAVPQAYLIERRWVSNAPATMDLLQALIGTDARLLVGNDAGDVWTDFVVPVAPPPGGVSTRLVTMASDGVPFAFRGVGVEGTPWTVAVGLPLAPIVLPVRQFLVEALAFTGGIIMLGGLAGWTLSRRITKPLRQLTESAEAIARATGAERRAVDKGDEVTRLAGSFGAMAARVDESHRQLAALVGELEDRVRARTADLESANKELEAFSYSVSHDLRAPVRAICGFAQILEEDHGETLPPEARRHVDIIVRRSRQMGELIDDLLAFSRIGRQSIGAEPVDMTRLAREVADELRAAAPDRAPIEIGELPPARGEPSLMKQVLTNLLQNARKFSATRADAAVQVGAFDQDGETVYFVRDNGVGFDMRYVDKLFGVFQRLHREEEFEGTGVGLALVQRIVQRHGGRIWAESAVGEGATFYFTLA